MPEVHFSKILIISSLPGGEPQTGRSLHDWLVAFSSSQKWHVSLEYKDVDNAAELVALLQVEATMVANSGVVPIVHIEAHGTDAEDGIWLKNGTQITWPELHPYLVQLNIATNLNLIVTLALCSGAHFISYMEPSDRAPCCFLVGPKAEITPGHLKDRLQEFYREIYKTEGNGLEALRRLNEGSEYGEPGAFIVSSATYFFKKTYQMYLEKLCTDEACRERAEKIREGLRGHMFPLPHSREIALFLMTSKLHFFQKHREIFFMLDLYPENENRFSVTYEDVYDL